MKRRISPDARSTYSGGHRVSFWLPVDRKEKAVAKQKLAVAKIEAQVTKVQSDASWEDQVEPDRQLRNKVSKTRCLDNLPSSLSSPQRWFLDLQPYIKEGFRVLKDDCPEWLVGNFGLDSSLVRPQEHRPVQEVMEWWELWLVTMVTLNTAVNLGRWIADRKRT